jgi:MtN3 and saliva related transmembrane protein
MDWINLLGLAAGTFTTTAFLPQVIRTWRSRSARDLSLQWLVTFIIGVSLWFIYGCFIGSLPVILANAVTLLLTLTILRFKLAYDSCD